MVALLWHAATVELVVLWALATVFVVGYRWRSRGAWHDSPEGRHIMRFTAALSVTFALTLLFRSLDPPLLPPDAPVPLIVGHWAVPLSHALGVQVLVFGAMAVELGNRLRLMLSGNSHGGHK